MECRNVMPYAVIDVIVEYIDVLGVAFGVDRGDRIWARATRHSQNTRPVGE